MVIVSWNVHRCIGSDRQYKPERVAEVLSAIGADVIALQEVDSSLRAESGEDQLSYIARRLGMEPVMGPTLRRDYGAYGNAILTKHEIASYQEYDLSYRKFEPRGALALNLNLPETHVSVLNVHLGLKFWERAFQINRVLHDLVRYDAPVGILLGDFNEWFPYSANNVRLESALGRVPRLATFPSLWPRFSLDRIFLFGSVENLSYEVPRTKLTRVASDHLPIIARFDIKS